MSDKTIELNQVVRDLLTTQREIEVASHEAVSSAHDKLWGAIYEEFPHLDPEQEHKLSFDDSTQTIRVNGKHKLSDESKGLAIKIATARQVDRMLKSTNEVKMWESIAAEYPDIDLDRAEAHVKFEWQDSREVVVLLVANLIIADTPE